MYKIIKFGRSVESLWYFSLLSIKVLGGNIDEILDKFTYSKDELVSKVHHKLTLSFSSLIERVLYEDKFLGTELIFRRKHKTLNFDRFKTFADDNLYIKEHELLQRDLNFSTPLNYIFSK